MTAVGARTIRLAPAAASVAMARRFVRICVDLPDTADLQLLVSELVTNVVSHVRDSDIELTVRDGDPVRVEVHNHESASDAYRQLVSSSSMPAVESIGGRGLAIVRSLASAVGLEDDPRGGKVVWFEYTPYVAARGSGVE